MARSWLLVCGLVVGCAADNPLFGLDPSGGTKGDDDPFGNGTSGFVTGTGGEGTGEGDGDDGGALPSGTTSDGDDDDDSDEGDETKGLPDDDDDDDDENGTTGIEQSSATSPDTMTDTDPGSGDFGGSEEETGDPPDEVTNCCFSHGLPGCEVPAVEDCVCVTDPFCCSVEWDAICVGVAINDCDAFCEFPQGDGNCCNGNGSPGCNDLKVQSCVCETDLMCCAGNWTGACAVQAHYECDAQCEPIPTTAHGCCDQGPAGCNDVDVQECTCEIDEYCCNVMWDALCISGAAANCGAGCFNEPGDGSCCDPHPGPGCTGGAGGPGIQICVCETMPACCLDSWTAACVAEAIDECGAGC